MLVVSSVIERVVSCYLLAFHVECVVLCYLLAFHVSQLLIPHLTYGKRVLPVTPFPAFLLEDFCFWAGVGSISS